jgi:hypothetical protein
LTARFDAVKFVIGHSSLAIQSLVPRQILSQAIDVQPRLTQ